MKALYRLVVVFTVISLSAPALAQTAEVARGERVFRTCVACHSLEANRNMTGPSLAELWGRKAGGLSSFSRYSSALQSSGIIWQDDTLDEWLKDPLRFIAGNTMTFPGIKDSRQRADLLAYLKETTRPGAAPTTSTQQDGMGGMMGMGAGSAPNLKKLDPDRRVEAVQLCRDTYRVKTADGHTRVFWERNLRFKTDSSEEGPEQGAPAILRAGMMGDRAAIIFATPGEISRMILPAC